MFGIGMGELMFVLVIALIIFGPGKLPEIGRTLGRFMGEIRKATSEIQETINVEMKEDDTPPPRTPVKTGRPPPPEPEPKPEPGETGDPDAERTGEDQPH